MIGRIKCFFGFHDLEPWLYIEGFSEAVSGWTCRRCMKVYWNH